MECENSNSQGISTEAMSTQLMSQIETQRKNWSESFSQNSTQIAPLSQLCQSADTSWMSGDSQSLMQPSIRHSVDQIVPHVVQGISMPQKFQNVLNAAESAKRSKFAAPKWTKGIIRLAYTRSPAYKKRSKKWYSLGFVILYSRFLFF